ncbi:efflux RND transporter periplasmic adaptor subunit [Aliikangiella sp. IMCC44359]|uniref:efflux RND transporter periplasmic adaptor subunit n=1 Tax=Aliikangiella sp. IMCC44359 TaxID=3459125 RepID=UPI00403A949E
MKFSASNTTDLIKVTFLSTILGLSILTTACSDDSAKDDKAKSEQTEEKKSSDKTASKNDDDKDKKKEDEKPPVPVEVVSVSRGDIQQTYSTITTLEAENDAQVVARSTGLLQTITIEEGDKVKKGDLLAQLDVEQLSLEVAQMEATSKKLHKELTRQQTLFNRKLGSRDALDRAKFEYQSQQAQFKLAKLKLRYASIRAPIDGIVTERMVKVGNLIRENDILFKIIDPSSLKAVLHLPEKELNNIKKGQNIFLNVDAYHDEVIIGQVERVRPSIDSDTGTFKVIAKLDNSGNKLKSGMFGKVEVVFDVHTNSLLLAQQAIITQDNRSHVFIVEDNIAKQTPVTTGFRHNGLVEIISGLTESDKVITTGQQILKHEALVEIVLTDNQETKPEEKEAATSVAAHP